uniref:protein-serine/threonine phosphatase n=1 Tax=Parascaris equorum TaxID=6256 RepID=A0A914RT86_PAREQ
MRISVVNGEIVDDEKGKENGGEEKDGETSETLDDEDEEDEPSTATARRHCFSESHSSNCTTSDDAAQNNGTPETQTAVSSDSEQSVDDDYNEDEEMSEDEEESEEVDEIDGSWHWRALGDHFYKKNDSLPLKDQMISAQPDVTVHSIKPEDEFVVIACDGIWYVFGSEKCRIT